MSIARLVLAASVLFALDAAATARADCNAAAVWAWPAPTEALGATGRIVLEGYGGDEAWVVDIARLSPRLAGAGEVVPLRVVETHRGSFEVSQVVLAAERPLRVGARYRLVLDGRPTPTVWSGARRNALEWTVGPSRRGAPRFRAAPRIDGTSYTAFGCGPAIYAHVLTGIDPREAVLFRVRVEPAAGGAPTEYLVPALDGRLDVGHGMCSGPFSLAAGIDYIIRIAAVDAAGRETPAPGPPLRATGPTP